MYQVICLFAAGAATAAAIVKWCLLALAVYAVKILLFSLSTGVSHAMAYIILESLRLRLADRFLHAPLGDVENHSIGEIKNMMVDKIENMEPPLAHMIPEGAGHIVLPIISIAALLCLDWRLALASLVTFPLSFVCMGPTFKISGDSFARYDQSSNDMNSAIAEYIEGIEVIKAFGRAGVSYEKYAGAITDFRTFMVKWLTSTFATMKLSFALFPSTLIGTLPVALALANSGTITGAQAALAVMLSISMVGSLAKLEVFSENMRQAKFTVESLEGFLEMPELPQPSVRADVKHTDVELKNVRFSYTGDEKDEVLHGVDLNLPEGSFTALVGPSGGEKQRISIARAILKNAPIIILDEATASIDPENEDKLQRSIAALTRGKTLLVIAHRLSTIRNADNIVVLKSGQIVAQGTQERLLDSCPLYRDMWLSHIGARSWAVSSAVKEA